MRFNQSNLEYCCGFASQLPKSGPKEVIFCGRSNIGKSSLINKLLNKKSLARTSKKPGKTATINFYKIDNSFYFVDLPGYGYAKTSFAEKQKWANLINNYINSERNFALFVQILDIRHDPTEQDFEMLSFLNLKNLPFLILLNKADKLKKNECEQRIHALNQTLETFKNIKKIPCSTVTGQGLSELKNTIINLI
jgi:GTP-binding protein